MKTADYIAALKEKHQITSDYGVAKLIGETPQKLGNWTSGRDCPGTLACIKIAEKLEVNPVQVLADVELERAEKAGKAKVAEEWKGVLEKLGALVVTMLMGAAITCPTPSQASVHRGSSTPVDTSYTSSKVRRRSKGSGLDTVISALCPAC